MQLVRAFWLAAYELWRFDARQAPCPPTSDVIRCLVQLTSTAKAVTQYKTINGNQEYKVYQYVQIDNENNEATMHYKTRT